MCERINKGIKKLENENEKNMIKNLTYISKINKNEKKINKLLQENIKNIIIKFEEDKIDIKFDSYIFSGLPIPDIEINEITFDTINITLKNDLKNFINIDKNKIKYKIEIRKLNEKFKQFESNTKFLKLGGLSCNTTYEIRICLLYNNFYSPWTQIQQITTKNKFK